VRPFLGAKLWEADSSDIAAAAALGVAWHSKQSEPNILGQAAKPATIASPAAAPSRPAEAPPPQTATPPTVAVPSFDVARIGPDGRAVIAGRAQPGAKIVLLDGDKEVAQGQADANGEWVVMAQDPPLGAGQHELRVIQHVEGHAPVTSDQVVVAIVPDQKQPARYPSGAKEETLVMIAPSSGAAKLVQPPSTAGVPKSGDLVMSTLDYDEGGRPLPTEAGGSFQPNPSSPASTSFGSTGSPRMASPWPASSCRSSAFPCRRLQTTANAWLSCVAKVSGTLRAHATATASATPRYMAPTRTRSATRT
jgi:hypothetical protein